MCVPLTPRHLLCVYVCRVLRLCFPVPRTCRTIFTASLFLERVVLYLPVYCATHCIVHEIRGCVRHLLQGTCSMCTFAVCYGCASLCLERIVLFVPVYCATHCIVHEIRGCVYHFLRGTCSVCTFAVCYGCASLCLERVVLFVPVYCATPCIVHEIRGCVHHLL